MEGRSHESSGSSHGAERSEPVRSRWTPRPEQILILESIFNSGMVNPPKDETVRIRKVLEQFGPVGDANVFYWFQNRRSRSRRRQRQIQAGLAGEGMSAPQPAGAIRYDLSSTSSGGCFVTPDSTPTLISSLPSSSSILPSSSTSCGGAAGEGGGYLFSISQQMGVPQIEQNAPSMIWPSDNSNLQYQSGLITVFVNGVPSEVPRGPIDIRAFFGPNVVLLHASGEPVPLNQYGISMHSLQLGENYFLVSRPT